MVCFHPLQKASSPPPEESSTGRAVNAEGLIYTDVDFKGMPSSSKAPPNQPPAEPAVIYSDVDFSKTAPPQQ